jgi:hypothetical protein
LLAVRASCLGCSIKSSVLGLGFAATGGARGVSLSVYGCARAMLEQASTFIWHVYVLDLKRRVHFALGSRGLGTR